MIIEIEKEARKITDDVKARKNNLKYEIEAKSNDLRNSLSYKAEKRLKKIAEKENEDMLIKLAELDKYRENELKVLNEFEKNNTEKLVAEITKRILS